jgi:hypothetical protein
LPIAEAAIQRVLAARDYTTGTFLPPRDWRELGPTRRHFHPGTELTLRLATGKSVVVGREVDRSCPIAD